MSLSFASLYLIIISICLLTDRIARRELNGI